MEKLLLKADFTVGKPPAEGFVQASPTFFSDGSCTLPFADNSLDEARLENELQKMTVQQQTAFLNDLHRVLKPGSGALITVPYAFSVAAYQDPMNLRPIVGDTFWFYNKAWREANGFTAGPYAAITANFDVNFPHQNVDQMLPSRSIETQQWMAKHLLNTVHHLVILLVKR